MLEASGLMVFYENMLALNNVSLKCDEGSDRGRVRRQQRGQIHPHVHPFRHHGGHSAKKRRWPAASASPSWARSVYGPIMMAVKPSLRAKQGIVLCPERRRIFPESSVLENLRIGGYLASPQAEETLEYVFSIFPPLAKIEKTPGRVSERRRAADAGHRPRAHGPAQTAAAG
jgi:branched-chain amino acid transport system ATP-binding protein